MPIYKEIKDNQAHIFIWKYEGEDVLNEELLICSEDLGKVENYHPKKKKEYLMIRQMLQNHLPDHKILYKTIGQPYLFPKDFFISISHSFPFASTSPTRLSIMPSLRNSFRIENK